LHQGTISVTSAGEGFGSKFIVNLPAHYFDISRHNSVENATDLGNNTKISRPNGFESTGGMNISKHSFDRKMNKVHIKNEDNNNGYDRTSSSSATDTSGNYLISVQSFTDSVDKSHTISHFKNHIGKPNLLAPNGNSSDRIDIRRVANSKEYNNRVPSILSVTGTGSMNNISQIGFPRRINNKEEEKSSFINSPRLVYVRNNQPDACNSFSAEIIPAIVLQGHILVVDDSAATRKMVSRWLVPLGLKVTEAKDGLDCLKQCHCSPNDVAGLSIDQAPYDAILIDDSMPNMHGPETIAILRRNGYQRLIVGLTGSVDNETRNKFTSAGADEVLTKPLDVDKLKHVFCSHQLLNMIV
jgi:CheY-like chemotaxis protein